MTKEIFREENIVLNAKLDDKWDAIRACGQVLVDGDYAMPNYIEDMIERENVASVYLGNGLAIPHGVANSEKNILCSGISFLQIPDGVDFGDEKAYVMIGIAGKNNTHIELLGRIALVCMEAENIDTLRTTQDKAKIIDMLTNITME